MANRYGALTLQLKQLSNLADIGSAHTNIVSASGTNKMSGVGRGGFTIPRDYAAAAAIDAQIGQVAYVYITDQVASGAAMDVASFIIKNIERKTTDDGVVLVVSGDGIEDQLTYTPLDDDAIDDGAGGKDTSDIDSIMGYAPSGWTYDIDGGAGTGSGNGTYFVSRGNNVLQLLIAASKQNAGEFFRLSSYSPPAKTISWRTSSDSSGVTLRLPQTPTDYDGSTTDGIIYDMVEDASFDHVVTRIRPYGAGLDDGRLDITGIDATDTGGDPAGYTTTFASNLIVNTTLETSLGYSIKQDIDFSSNRAADVTDATELTTAAVALWNEGISYLDARDGSKKFYRLSCNVAADLLPGQTVTISYTEYEGGISGGSAIWTVSGSFTIHEVTNRVSNSGDTAGTRVTDLLVSDTITPRATGASLVADALRTARETTRKSNALTTPGAVAESRTIGTDLPLTGGGDLSADRTIGLGNLSAYGTANQIFGMVAAANDVEYKTLTAGTDISITHGVGTITINNTAGAAGAGEAYVTIGNTAGLSAERALTAGSGISITDAGANSTVTIATDGSEAAANLAYVTIGNTASLTAERALTAGDGIDLTDGGANTTVTLAVDVTDIIGNGLTETTNNIVLGTPGTLSQSSTNAVTASSHTHAITTTDDGDTNTLTILASDVNGRIRLDGLGIRATASNNGVRLADAGWIGISNSEGRIIFDNLATDIVRVANANFFVNETANASMTTGITVNQGAADNEIISFKSSDVAHGMTSITETDTFGYFTKSGNQGGGGFDAGGLRVRGVRDAGANANRALVLSGILGEAAETTVTLGAAGTSGVVQFTAGVISGTDAVPVASNGNAFCFSNFGETIGIMKGDGALHLAGALNLEGTGIVATFGDGTSSAQIVLDGAASNVRDILYRTNGSTRWNVRCDNAGETGSDAGSNYDILRYNDSGTFLGTALTIQRSDGAIQVGSPTGGFKGTGTINAQGVYDDNTLLTDHVFEPDYPLPTIAEMTRYFKEHLHLPTIPGREEWERRGSFSLGELATHLWETVEVQARYIAELNERLKAVEHGS